MLSELIRTCVIFTLLIINFVTSFDEIIYAALMIQKRGHFSANPKQV